MDHVRRFLPFVLPLLLSLAVPSCALLELIGNSLSRLHDNSVSYFNAYYNAKRNFDEAEDAIRTAERAARGKSSTVQRLPPPTGPVRDKLNTVIDKCSSILSFYPQSALVDDALFLIGKSYYYLQEYVKAERKFSELLTEFPNSDLALESQLWLAWTLQNINRSPEAQQVASHLASTAGEQKEYSLAAQAYALLGTLAREENRVRDAVELYAKAAEITPDDFYAATAYVTLGDLYFSQRDYENAVTAYTKAFDRTSDIYLNYYSRIQAARAFSAMKRYDTATYLTGNMLDQYRYAEFHPTIRLEHAHALLQTGRIDEALDEYQYLDSTYQRTDVGTRAAWALGQYYELQRGEYEKARGYYARASSIADTSVAPQARRKESGLGKILVLRRQLAVQDSLVALSDSLLKYPDHFVQAVDTVAIDSVGQRADTLQVHAPPQRTMFQPVNKDSVRAVKARAAYDLGEAFYTEIELPDSALVWFQRAVDWNVDSTLVPRALFILAELGRATGTRTEEETIGLYRTIVDNFPKSPYAEEARKILGLPLTQRTKEEVDRSYAVAESLLLQGHYDAAIERLKAIVDENPTEPLAAKSQFAIGWVYEYCLAKPDSALASYKMLVEQFKNSPYAAAVRKRISDAEKTDISTQPTQQSTPQPPPAVAKPRTEADDDTLLKSKVPTRGGTKQDTTKIKKIE